MNKKIQWIATPVAWNKWKVNSLVLKDVTIQGNKAQYMKLTYYFLQIYVNLQLLTSHKPSVVVYICNTSTQEAETGGSQVQGQPGLHYEFQGKLCYIGKLCLNNKV
jgi:hypothetical protein